MVSQKKTFLFSRVKGSETLREVLSGGEKKTTDVINSFSGRVPASWGIKEVKLEPVTYLHNCVTALALIKGGKT